MLSTQPMYIDYLQSTIGTIELRASDQGLISLYFRARQQASIAHPILDRTKTQLEEYFAGTRRRFDIPLDLSGTDFQKSVWQKLLDIPFGQTCSYHDIAVAINNAKAVRAVGAANGRNPVSIIVPCHRVIGSNGTLTGYAGGVEKKAWLLRHENAIE